jgi:hypothetical protein
MQPKWVIVLVLLMDALAGAEGMKLIPEPFAPWATLAALVLGNALALFGYPLLRRAGQAVPPAAIALLVGALALSGCTGTLTPTYKTLAGMADAVTAAAGVLPSSCEARQSVLVANAKNHAELDAAEKAAAEVHAQCEVAGNSLVAASKGLRLARDVTRDIDKGIRDPKDLMVWVSAALNLYRNLGPMLSTFGVKLPGF